MKVLGKGRCTHVISALGRWRQKEEDQDCKIRKLYSGFEARVDNKKCCLTAQHNNTKHKQTAWEKKNGEN